MKPLFARFFYRLARSFGVPEIQHRLDLIQTELERFAHTPDHRFGALERYLEKRLNDYLTDQAAHHERLVVDLHQLLNEAQASLSSSTRQHTEIVTNEIRVHLEGEIRTTKRDLDNIRRMAASTPPQVNIEKISAPINAKSAIDDALYVSLEDHFRGEREEVHKRQTEYVPYVKEIVSEKFPLLDLGCGRGEWLKVMSENNISAKGIDCNVASIVECHESGLKAELGELLETLTQLPDASLGAITMFQVLEHLPFDVMVRVLREARRVLIDGGVFIGEIPNSETLRVGASTFWIDPTHEKPIFPAVLSFVATSVGFSGVTGKYSSPLAPIPDLTGLPENASKVILEIHHAINGPGDFALIATA